jgi:hypothetical protein
MLLTNEKIDVTYSMMQENNMTKLSQSGTPQFGIPVDPKDPNKCLEWKCFEDMKDEDYDKIEEYFLAKKTKGEN